VGGSMGRKPPNPVDVHLGNRIKTRRMMLNFSQTDLAKHCGITFQQIQKYERGANRVSASRLQEFAKLLEVPASFFFEGLPSYGSRKNKAAPEDLAQQLLSTREGIDLTKAFISINDKSLRRSIVSLVEQIANV
jgi:transcriptional regulator with XRE-family HTH domain